MLPRVINQEPRKGDSFPDSKVKHGTYSGAALHTKRDEALCPACRAARDAYQQDHNRRPTQRQRHRIASRAARIVAAEFRDTHEAEYRAIFTAKFDELISESTPIAGQDERTRRRTLHKQAASYAMGILRARFSKEYKLAYIAAKIQARRELRESNGI